MVAFSPTLTATLLAFFISSAVSLPNPQGGRFDRRPPFGFDNNDNRNSNTNTNVNTNYNNNANSNYGGRGGYGRYGGYGSYGGYGRFGPPYIEVEKRDESNIGDGGANELDELPIQKYAQDDGLDDDSDYDDYDDEVLDKRDAVRYYGYGYPGRRYGYYRTYGVPPEAEEEEPLDEDEKDQEPQEEETTDNKLSKRFYYRRFGVRRFGYPRRFGIRRFGYRYGYRFPPRQ